jgi:hypothetical protein
MLKPATDLKFESIKNWRSPTKHAVINQCVLKDLASMYPIHSIFALTICLLSLMFLSTLRAEQSDASTWLKPLLTPCFGKDEKAATKGREKIETTYVTPELKKLLARDRADAKRTGEIGRLDFDWVIAAQDAPKAWKLGQASIEKGKMRVPVQTQWDGGEWNTHVFVLEKGTDGWIIVDVLYSDGSSLIELLKQPL